MELFTLGHGSGYTERDVREQARALTGFTASYKNGYGWVKFRWDRNRHDDAMKVIFGKAGPFGWKQAVQLAIEQPAHKTFFTRKLWGYFIPEPADDETQAALELLYVQSGYSTRQVLSAILKHPRLYEGPRMVKPPAVYLAGMLRTLGDRIATEDYIWLSILAGQLLFYPPNVSGWNDDRWLDTSTFRARWLLARRVLQKHSYNPEHTQARRGPVRPGQAGRAGNRVLGCAATDRPDPKRAARLRRERDGSRRRRRQPPEELPTHDPQRPAPPRRRLTGDADLVSSSGCNHCDEFSRVTMLRRAVAEAGNGLPAIEPGMPAPAGTGLDRRKFLSRTLGAALTVYGAASLAPRMLDEGIARAAVTAGAGRRVLVSIFAPGGWDALSLLYPIGDPRYHKLRTTLALKGSTGLHSTRTSGCTGTRRCSPWRAFTRAGA